MRLALALAVIPSVLIHLAAVVAVTLSLHHAHQVASVMPIDLLDVHGTPHPPAPKPPVPKPPAPKPAVPKPPAPKPEVAYNQHPTPQPPKPTDVHPPKPPVPKPVVPAAPASQPADGTLASELTTYAPTAARLVLLLRTDRIRRTNYRVAVEGLLEMLPDYWSLLGSAGAPALGSFDSLLIATANPLDVDQTFLAARYHGTEAAARALLDRGERGTVRWESYRGVELGRRPPGMFRDPRVLLAPVPGLVVLTRPEFVDGLLDGLPTPASAPSSGPVLAAASQPSPPSSQPASQPASSAASSPASQPQSWLERLAELEKASGTDPSGPLMLLTATDLPGLLDLDDNGEIPTSLSMGLRDPDAPASDPFVDPASMPAVDPFAAADPVILDALLGFHSATDADAFASTTWPALRKAVESQLAARLIAKDLDALEPKIDGLNLRFHLEVPGPHVVLILTLIRSLIPPPPNIPQDSPAPLRPAPPVPSQP